MDSDAFQSRTLRHCEKYFEGVVDGLKAGRLTFFDRSTNRRPTVIFPTRVLFYEMPGQMAAELVGASPSFEGLQVSTIAARSTDDFLGNFPTDDDTPPTLNVEDSGSLLLKGLNVFGNVKSEHIANRYPFLNKAIPKKIIIHAPENKNGVANALRFRDVQDLWLERSFFVSTSPTAARARYFHAAWAISDEMSSSEYSRRLRMVYPPPGAGPPPKFELVTITASRNVKPDGLSQPAALLSFDTGRSESELQAAANFASICTIEPMSEQTIDDFLNDHGRILSVGLGGIRIVRQPTLEWLVTPPDEEDRYIRPDFLLVDAEGRAHIGDLKLPLVGKQRLTTTRSKRRRFRVGVSDGIAQLAHYREFFEVPAHRDQLEAKYQVSLAGSPRLILVVGTWENLDAESSRQARRSVDRSVEIVDFDTLRALYLAATLGHKLTTPPEVPVPVW